MPGTYEGLASYQRSIARVQRSWPGFLAKRAERLKQDGRFGVAAEKVAENQNILEDLFTEVLDWSPGDLNNQVGRSDLLLSRLGIKHLLLEVKRPGALTWSEHAVNIALEQARGYSDQQKVRCIAVSDGTRFSCHRSWPWRGAAARAFAAGFCGRPFDALVADHGRHLPACRAVCR